MVEIDHGEPCAIFEFGHQEGGKRRRYFEVLIPANFLVALKDGNLRRFMAVVGHQGELKNDDSESYNK